jgi:hypothetical protein
MPKKFRLASPVGPQRTARVCAVRPHRKTPSKLHLKLMLGAIVENGLDGVKASFRVAIESFSTIADVEKEVSVIEDADPGKLVGHGALVYREARRDAEDLRSLAMEPFWKRPSVMPSGMPTST